MTLNDVVATASRLAREASKDPRTGSAWHVWQVRNALLEHMGELEFASWDCRLLSPTASRAPARVLPGEEA